MDEELKELLGMVLSDLLTVMRKANELRERELVLAERTESRVARDQYHRLRVSYMKNGITVPEELKP